MKMMDKKNVLEYIKKIFSIRHNFLLRIQVNKTNNKKKHSSYKDQYLNQEVEKKEICSKLFLLKKLKKSPF